MGKVCSTHTPEAPCSFSPRFDARLPRLPSAEGCRTRAGNSRGLRSFSLLDSEGRQAGRASQASPFLTPSSADDLGRKGSTAFLNRAGDAGFALAPGGEFQNLFSLCGQDSGTRALVQAIALGARHPSTTGEGLVDYYMRFGWSEVRRDAFDARQAPTGWSCDLLGTPPVVFMEYRTAAFSLPNSMRAAAWLERSTAKAPGLAFVLAPGTKDLFQDKEPA